ncbi:MAG: multicopper oxidase domain-containing protein [Actinomycetota bacterium]|nr:multicopper oxidase domain-containing protein [Actinomycetota bacterium]
MKASGRRSPLRTFGIVLAAVTALAVLAGGAVLGIGLALWASAAVDTSDEVEFDTPLAIPPLAPSRLDADGRRVFDLHIRAGSHEFLPGTSTPTWGINQDYLGPTLRARRGERVVINVHNGVDEATSMHWHGMHLPARMDGGPHQLIQPGRTWSPGWEIDQPAASLWYHPHLHGSTEEHVYRGLAGMFILDDERSRGLGLPAEYGVDDIPVIVQDKKIDGGRLDHSPAMVAPTGVLGDTVAVNGTTNPYLDVTTQRVRLRLLNASNARIYNFGFDDDRAFAIVGSDAGLLPAPVEADRILLSPGERAEIVATMTPGEDAVLRSYPAELGADFFTQRFAGGDDTLDLLQLRATESLAPSGDIPAVLTERPGLDQADAVQTRHFRLGGTSINGLGMDTERIDEVVTVGDTEIWELRNADGTPHNFHVHDVRFQVLDLDGNKPPAHLSGWKDTVYLRPGSSARLIMRFTDYTDPSFPYMFHCHLLRHEDQGMMGQFVVVEAGQRAAVSPTGEPGHDHDGH